MIKIFKQNLRLILCLLLPLTIGPRIDAQQEDTQENTAAEQQAPPISNDQLEALVAPIALYPDQLLGQVLVASTYPLEIVQLAQWMQENSNLKGDALVEAVKKQNWDPSIQALVTFPDLVKQLSGNIQWTTDLGNAFLAQQSDVMNAIQSMRTQAKDSGKLQSTQQQSVQTQVENNKTVVVIQPTDPQTMYVPSYNPESIWGAGAYSYPSISYPWGSHVATGLISFGAGAALGSWGHGGWGWNTGWGHGEINMNNNFVRNNNLNAARTNIANNRNTGVWQHNAQHRGGTPYSNRQTANRFGGQQANLGNRNFAGAGVNRQAGNLAGQRQGNLSGGNRSLARADFGNSGNRVGNRQVQGSSFGNRSAFGGGGSGNFARASSARGHSSLGGGGRSFGGGGRGGGGRGGGGRRR